jgi:hypothetical protein
MMGISGDFAHLPTGAGFRNHPQPQYPGRRLNQDIKNRLGTRRWSAPVLIQYIQPDLMGFIPIAVSKHDTKP